MTTILERQKLKKIHRPALFMPAYQKWKQEMVLIHMQLVKLRDIFERASFMLSKRDFERLDGLEQLQRCIQKKINLLFQKPGIRQLQLHHSQYYNFEDLTSEIDRALTRLSSSLTNLKKEKFANENNTTFCL